MAIKHRMTAKELIAILSAMHPDQLVWYSGTTDKAESMRQRLARYKKEGRCGKCAKPELHTKTLCKACATKHKAQSDDYRKRYAAIIEEKRQAQKLKDKPRRDAIRKAKQQRKTIAEFIEAFTLLLPLNTKRARYQFDFTKYED